MTRKTRMTARVLAVAASLALPSSSALSQSSAEQESLLQACREAGESGDWGSCREAGIAFALGEGGDRDFDKAVWALGRACERGAIESACADREEVGAIRDYEAALAVMQAWEDVDWPTTVQSQQRAIAAKRDGLEAVVVAFRRVADHNLPDWTACAIYQEGRVWHSMATALRDLPRPDFGLDDEAADEYDLILAEFAAQYDEQAETVWQSAVESLRTMGISSQCTVDMTAALTELTGFKGPRSP